MVHLWVGGAGSLWLLILAFACRSGFPLLLLLIAGGARVQARMRLSS